MLPPRVQALNVSGCSGFFRGLEFLMVHKAFGFRALSGLEPCSAGLNISGAMRVLDSVRSLDVRVRV